MRFARFSALARVLPAARLKNDLETKFLVQLAFLNVREPRNLRQ